MPSFVFLLAWRYLKSASENAAITTMIKICFCSITLASCSLALIIGIRNGFEKATCKILQGLHSDIIIHAHDDDIANIKHIIQSEVPQVESMYLNKEEQIMLQNKNSKEIAPALLKGIEPANKHLATILQLHKNTSNSSISLEKILVAKGIMIGETLAKNLYLEKKDAASILFMSDYQSHRHKILLDEEHASVEDFFKTGIDDFDSSLAICSLAFFEKIFPDHDNVQISINLAPNILLEKVTAKLREKFPNHNIFSWKELYPALVTALLVEKQAMILILTLICLLALVQIFSVIFMMIIHKKRDLALLISMHASIKDLSAIFNIIALGISAIASALGLLLTFVISWYCKKYSLVKLPDTYYISHVPIEIDITSCVFIFLSITALSFCVAWFSTRYLCHQNYQMALRAE